MTTGQRPFPETQVPRLIDEILNREPRHPRELNPRISPGLESIILKALDKNPEHRYQSARELLVDQERLSISLPLLVARPKRHTRRNAILLGTIFLIVLLGAWFGFKFWRARSDTGVRETVLIGEFDNRTGEPVFDQTVAELLAISLEQSHRLSVFPHSRLRDVLQRMEQPAEASIDEKIGLEICQREDLQALVIGSISKIGGGYVIVARALTADGKSLVSSQQTAASAGQVPAALDLVSQELRNGLGESQSTVQATSRELARVTSPSIEAISFYTLGKQRLASSDPQGAILYFQKALEKDPQFAMARDYLGVAYTNIYDSERAVQQMHAASLLADRVTESEKAKILGDYNLIIANFDQACGYFQVLTQLQPQDPSAYINLGLCYAGKFDFAGAYAETEKGMRLQPGSSSVRSNLSMFSFLKGDTANSLALAKEVLRDHPSDFEGLSNLGRGYLLSGDLAQARQTFEKMVKAGGDTEAEGHASLADLALATGQYREARAQLEAAIVTAESRANTFAGVKDRLTVAGLSLAEGSLGPFQAEISQIESRATDPAHILLLGILSARGHRMEDAQKLLRKLEGMAAENQVPRLKSFQYLLQAELQLSQGNAPGAVDSAKTAVQYENSTLALETLATAEAAAGKNQDAIATYEQVLARANERAFSYDAPGFHHVVDIHFHLGNLY
ncbi:MAG: tetratricopeptide repeat protein, partial [Candidatus Acidiferrales bacterium]